MTDIEGYTREYLRQYDEQSFELHAIAARRRQVLKSMGRHPHQHILEVGCGAESCFLFLDDYITYTVVEPAEMFVQRARRAAAAKPNVEILHGYMEQLADGLDERRSFDFIILSSVLHEVPDPAALLRAVRHVAGPRTTVHINVPNVYSFHRLLALEMGLIADVFAPSALEKRFGRHTRFDRQRLVRTVEDNGFRVLHFETYLIKLFTHEQMDALARHGIATPDMIAALERMTKYLPDMGCEMFVEASVAG